MEPSERQDTSTGSLPTQTPILVNEEDHTEGQSEPSQPLTSIAFPSTRPLSLQEALSLLQTNCFDLRQLKCKVAILARGRRLYIVLAVPDSIECDLAVSEDGHITMCGKPVVNG